MEPTKTKYQNHTHESIELSENPEKLSPRINPIKSRKIPAANISIEVKSSKFFGNWSFGEIKVKNAQRKLPSNTSNI